jgi:CD109 antigen
VGDVVKATARVTNRMAQPAAMVMLDLPVPAGFGPEADDFAALVQKGAIARFQVQPRKVLVYLRDLRPGQPLELTYGLRATMPVKVAVAGARAYEYYDPDKEGRSPGERLTVKARD